MRGCSAEASASLRPSATAGSCDEEEILPILDPRRHRIGMCEAVLQRVPIEEVSSAHFAYSIETIMTVDKLKKALIQRYAPLFAGPTPVVRGVAPLLSFRFSDAW
jgi:hypothetical protein